MVKLKAEDLEAADSVSRVSHGFGKRFGLDLERSGARAGVGFWKDLREGANWKAALCKGLEREISEKGSRMLGTKKLRILEG